MTTPLIGGRYVRDKKTGALTRVPVEQTPAPAAPTEPTEPVAPAETNETDTAAAVKKKGN